MNSQESSVSECVRRVAQVPGGQANATAAGRRSLCRSALFRAEAKPPILGKTADYSSVPQASATALLEELSRLEDSFPCRVRVLVTDTDDNETFCAAYTLQSGCGCQCVRLAL